MFLKAATCFFLVVVIVVIVLDCHQSELFKDEPTNHILNYDKTVLYNMNGLFRFYSSGSPASVFTTNTTNHEMVKMVVAFYSNFQDMACTSLSTDDLPPETCRNYFIDMNSSRDDYFDSLSFNETGCKSVKALTSNSMDHSMIRVLGNYYNLMKRCVRLDTVSFERMIVSADQETYYVSITGNMCALVLSRIIYMSFDNYGCFSITPLASYDSTMNTIQILISRVKPYNKLKMYTDTVSNLAETNKITNAMPCTAYYLNLNDKVKVTSNIDVSSTLTLILTSKYLTSQPKINISIPTNYSNVATTVVAGSISVLFDPTILDITRRFSIVVAYGIPVSNITYTLPRGMCATIDAGEPFHIVLTYSLDMMIVVCHTKDVTYFTQSPVTDGMNCVMLKYSIPAVSTVIDAAGLLAEIKKHAPLVNFTAIPNYALLGKHLGYNF